MTCTASPAGYFPTPPGLPAGVSLPTFVPPVVTLGYCCNIQVPPWGSFPGPFPPFPLPAAVVAAVAALNALEAAIEATFDAVAIPCPLE